MVQSDTVVLVKAFVMRVWRTIPPLLRAISRIAWTFVRRVCCELDLSGPFVAIHFFRRLDRSWTSGFQPERWNEVGICDFASPARLYGLYCNADYLYDRSVISSPLVYPLFYYAKPGN